MNLLTKHIKYKYTLRYGAWMRIIANRWRKKGDLKM